MDELIAFIKARLDEEEATARAAADCGGHRAPGWAALTTPADTGWVVDAADPSPAEVAEASRAHATATGHTVRSEHVQVTEYRHTGTLPLDYPG